MEEENKMEEGRVEEEGEKECRKVLERIKKKIKKASHNRIELFFITRRKTGKTNSIKYEVLQTLITKDIRRVFKRIEKGKINELLDTSKVRFVKYDPATIHDQQTVEFIDASEVQYLNQIREDMKSPDLDTFIIGGFEVPWAYAVKMDDVNLILFRKFSQSRLLQRKGWIPLFVKDGMFNRLKRLALTVDEEIDCIYDIEKNMMYIIDKKQFEDIFSFMDIFTNEIDNNKFELEKRDLVDDVDLLVKLCKTDPRKVRKLYSVLRSPGLRNLKKKEVERICYEYILDLDFTASKQMIVNMKDLWTILRVLGDDYLHSTVTNFHYEVYSKSGGLKMRIDRTVIKGFEVTVEGRVVNASRIDWNWGDNSKRGKEWFPAKHRYGDQGKYTIMVTAFRGSLSVAEEIPIAIP
ncbi:MAG: DUF4868 domain-containing protein [Theionarchaea archaeon]|nr:DUF4868 domain-containing protein [Theionarchaea archaeon]